MRCAILLLAAVSMPGFAPAPFPRPPREELKRLQGTWEMVRAQNDAIEENAKYFNELPPKRTWTFAGDRLTVSTASRKNRVRITLDAQATPKRLVLWLPVPVFGDDRIVAIYRLEGDELTVCYVKGAWDKFPSAFPGPDDGSHTLQVFKRKG